MPEDGSGTNCTKEKFIILTQQFFWIDENKVNSKVSAQVLWAGSWQHLMCDDASRQMTRTSPSSRSRNSAGSEQTNIATNPLSQFFYCERGSER